MDVGQAEGSDRTFGPWEPEPLVTNRSVSVTEMRRTVSLLTWTCLKSVLTACFRIILINCLSKHSWNEYDGVTLLS